MKIIELRAENFKRLSAVRIHPDRRLALITGRNGAGKSSVLDAVWCALGGKDAVPTKPVRDGAERALVYVDLGDLRVTRKFTGDDRSTLVVQSRDGLKHPSPQAVLDKLVGQLSFDPLAFARMPSKQQAATLRQLVPGLDTGKLDAERKALFDKRTDVNREIKALAAQLEAMPPVNAPDEEASVAELAKQHQIAVETEQANHRARRDFDAAELALAEARRGLEAAHKRLADAEKEAARARSVVDAIETPNIDGLVEQIRCAENTNTSVRAKKARAAKAAELAKREASAGKLTEKLSEIDAHKAQVLAAAKLPVPGLAVDGDAVTFKSVPFEQASSAEQLRVGLAIGAALNPTLRVVLVRDGSLLDEDGLQLVADWAEANDMQVIMERVADGAPAGVVIEDGEVAGGDVALEADHPALQLVMGAAPVDEEW